MSILALFSRLDELEIYVELSGSQLKINAPKGALTPGLISEIKEKKQEMIEFLQSNEQSQVKFTPIVPSEKKEYYNLSSVQERLYFLQQMDKKSTVYNMPQTIDLGENIKLKRLEQTFKKLIKRHESLRTSLEMVDDNLLVQKVHADVEFKIEYYPLDKPVKDDPALTPSAIFSDFVNPFDLSQAPLIRARLVKTKEKNYILLVDIHHIISDGASEQVMRKDFMSLYYGRELPPLKLQYKEYAEWQNSETQMGVSKAQEVYWENEFSGEIPRLNLPMDYVRPPIQSFEGAEIFFDIPGKDTADLKKIALERGFTLNTVLYAIFNILMVKLCGQEDIITGILTAGRKHADLQGIIGMFVNTLAIRNYFPGEKTFEVLLQEVNNKMLKAFENQDYQFENLVEKVVKVRDAARNPIFDVMFNLQNMSTDPGGISQEQTEETKETEASQVETLTYKRDTAKFDLTMIVVERAGRLHFIWNYCTRLFRQETIERFTHYFKKIISSAIMIPGIKIYEIEIISEAEKTAILYDFNDTKAGYPKGKTLHELFQDQVERKQDQIALVFKDKQMTYKKLNGRANQLGRVLKSRGVAADTPVGMMLEHSLDIIVALIAILKVGGGYLPIEPETPTRRIVSMLEDGHLSILLTKSQDIKNHPFMVLQRSQIQKSKSSPLVTRRQAQVKDFDRLPIPDRSLVDYEKYNKYIGQAMVKNAISLQATRGCPYHCTYCHKIWPKTHVARSAENIFNEVQLYYNMGVRRFSFVDDVFNLDIKNSTRFFHLIIENGLKVQLFFSNGMRGDILTKEYIDLMVRAGTINLAIALETASPRLQQLINKKLDLQKLKENIDYLVETYPLVILELFTMHGFPTETEEEARMTLDFIKGFRWLHFPYVFVLKIYPNTGMAKLAIKNGISIEAINNSEDLAFHELPTTLPFERSFTLYYQSEFLNDYFLSKERLLHVLPYQMKVLTEDEIVQKYDSYLPIEIGSLEDLLQFVGLAESELDGEDGLSDDEISVPGLNTQIKTHFQKKEPPGDALRILMLDLSQFFLADSIIQYDVVDPPLGLMYVVTYLQRQFGDRVDCKIAKSRIDFGNYAELKALVEEFKPDVIGVRTLTFYKNFFHKTIALIRQWGINVPIIAGGPYATSSYETLLQDRNINLVVLGEGEVTFSQLVQKIMENGGKLPGEKVLNEIAGIAYTPTVNLSKGMCDYNREIIMLDELEDILTRESDDNLKLFNQSKNLAYIIFTSGSTGNPKGVLIDHFSVVNLAFSQIKEFGITGKDKVLQFSSICFDASVEQIFIALFSGANLVLIDKTTLLEAGEFEKFIASRGITHIHAVPSFLNSIWLDDTYDLKRIISGGDICPVSLAKKWSGNCDFYNEYGPTETTVTSIELKLKDIDEALPRLPIGKPVGNTVVYLFDRWLKPVPPGITGAMYIGGDGVARGYLNRPGLTRESFVTNPLKKEKRLYKTGDMARWLPNGNLEFLGRNDYQVKIRGFRIELGEIQSRLLSFSDLKDVIVVEKGKGSEDKYLCAYIVTDSEVSASGLREYLLKYLPEYMIPLHFTFLKKIPLTSTGKINRKALPEPKLEAGDRNITPRDEVEKKLVDIWAEVLGVEKEVIGIDSDFFQLGGHSLKATILAAKIHKELNVKIMLAELFKTPTIRGLRESIGGLAEDKYASIEPVERKEYYRLSAGQKRLYFLQQMNLKSVGYNISQVKVLEGELHRKKLAETFKKLIRRYESLRTSFEMLEEEPVQRIRHQVEFDIEYLDSFPDVDTVIRDFFRPFDLAQAPLLRIGIINAGNLRHVMVIDTHHIISDGISQRILVEDFMALSAGVELPPLRLEYKDYSEWFNGLLASGDLENQEKYWLQEFAGDISPLLLPTDYPRPEFRSFEGEILRFDLDLKEIEVLNNIAKYESVTLYMVLLAIINILLSKITSQEDIVIGTSVAGRGHSDLQKLVGIFINTLALRNHPRREKTFSQFLGQVKQRTLQAFENQNYQFEDLVNKVVPNRNTKHHPLFDVMFSFQTSRGNPSGENPPKSSGLKVNSYEHEKFESKFDVTIRFNDLGDKLIIAFEYCSTLFKRETMERYFKNFREILSAVTNNKHKKIKDIRISHDLLESPANIPQMDFGF